MTPILWLTFATLSFAAADPLHLPLEADSQEILFHSKLAGPLSTAQNRGIDSAIKAGERNHEWLALINLTRAPGDRLSFTSPETQGAYPIERPFEYSPSSITSDLDQLKAELPPEMSRVLFGRGPFTPEPPIPATDFLRWGRRLDVIYQMALRWNLMEPYLPALAKRRRMDIRGHYFLKKMDPALRRLKLASPDTWSTDEAAKFRDWLISMCLNDPKRALAKCRQELDRQIAIGADLNPAYDRWLPESREVFAAFFAIPPHAMRRDLDFSSPERLVAPFHDPEDETLRRFLAENIEEEWRLENWNLKLAFSPQAAIRVKFVPGMNPFVDRLGGDIITLNADQPLTEFDARWIIRHEFGHTLGIPDCYIEFYDQARHVIIGYQIDVDNIMCSRRGRIRSVHLEELRKYR